MTPLNEALKGEICAYCGNKDGEMCLAGVPWYCVSINCSSFQEEPIPKSVKRRRVNPLRFLVETF